ncbi:MAG: asparagine--tRNA ligase [Patescibacteria group bacterium]|nr:asparagine--tRNA ligase [Patescibacteria group bacterium]MDD5120971.1 asparagine--tRNA ligase [Patescibacteria group bacterium]MDD5222143.1 asparagine--tRNA ligase [Patescibacteria group bacterium]MDD5396414.1 asparagine--tRNA ligase [Patescibacteria group bacterium]
MSIHILLESIDQHLNKTVSLRGWVFNFRSSGSIYFIQFRDGTGQIQGVISKKEVGTGVWDACQKLTIESSVEMTGKAYKDERSPYGYEMAVTDLKIIQVAEEYPIAKKEHGVDFLMDNRHLWLRSSRQAAILKVRDEVIWAIRSFFHQEGFVLTDSPILTPTACEGSTTLFSTDYFGEKAYLSQSGQLYLEATIYSLNKVYDFGPTFRAEKSKTRRHLIEFWMMDAEAAFVEHDENMKIQENLVSYVVEQVLKNRQKELALLGRDTKALEKIKAPFYHLTYDEAIKFLDKKGVAIKWGDDFGGDEETIISKSFDKPVFIEKYPAQIKAFYMQPDPGDSRLVLNNDLIAPEGYGEIIGGSQRIHDLKILEDKIKQCKMKREPLKWYIDLRRYGSVPHSGFGIGLERTVGWLCGLEHVRETIPFPRMINRLKP